MTPDDKRDELIGIKVVDVTKKEELVKFRFDHTRLVLGATFYEVGYGQSVQYRVTEAPVICVGYEDRPTLSWKGITKDETETVDFLITLGLEHYGPKIYLDDEIVEVNGMKFLTR